MKSASFFITGLLLTTLASPALAQQEPEGWEVTVGAGAVYAPVFEGSDNYGLSLFPDLRIKYKDDFFASVPGGIGYNVINQNGWKAGPIAKIRFGREEDSGGSPFLITGDSDALDGLGDVDTAGEVGGFVQYQYAFLRSRLELRQGFGGHDGLVGDASLDYIGQTGPVRYSFGPRASYGSEDYMDTYFGINGTQSANSGLATYDADGGISSYGFGGSAVMPVSPKTTLSFFGGYDRMGDEAADSPLIDERGDRNQFTIGMAIGYRFN